MAKYWVQFNRHQLCVFTFHVIILVNNAFFLIFDELVFTRKFRTFSKENTDFETSKHPVFSFPYEWKFYSRWCQVLMTITYALMVISDILLIVTCSEKSKALKCLNRAADLFVISVVFPLSFCVGIVYWVWYLIKNGDVLDQGADGSFTYLILTHNKHTFPMAILTVELLFVHHKRPSYLDGLLTSLFPGLCYTIFACLLGTVYNTWAYPPLYANCLCRYCFFGVGAFLTAAFYNVAFFMDRWFAVDHPRYEKFKRRNS